MESEKAGKGLIKKINSLKIKKYQQRYESFFIEGEKICEELLLSDFIIETIVISERFKTKNNVLLDAINGGKYRVFSTTTDEFENLSETQSPQGIAVVSKMKIHKPILEKPIIVLDEIADPGNLGTIIRTADWFGFQQVVLSKGCASVYNGKVIRSSMGSVFHLNIIEVEDLQLFLVEYFPTTVIYAATIDGDIDLKKISKQGTNFGIVFGNESRGVSDKLDSIIDYKFKITGRGRAESLNVAVAAGITLQHFEKFLD